MRERTREDMQYGKCKERARGDEQQQTWPRIAFLFWSGTHLSVSATYLSPAYELSRLEKHGLSTGDSFEDGRNGQHSKSKARRVHGGAGAIRTPCTYIAILTANNCAGWLGLRVATHGRRRWTYGCPVRALLRLARCIMAAVCHLLPSCSGFRIQVEI